MLDRNVQVVEVLLMERAFRAELSRVRLEDPSSVKHPMTADDHVVARALRYAVYDVELFDADCARIRANIDVGAYVTAFEDLCTTLRAVGGMNAKTRDMLRLTLRDAARIAHLDLALIDQKDA